MNTGARLTGRALAQTAVTLDSNIVTMPAGSSAVPAPIVPPPSTSPQTPPPTYTPAPTSPYSNPAPMVIVQNQNPQASANMNTTADQQAQLSGLVATLQSLRAQVQARQQGSSFGQGVRAIAMNLGKGSVGADVATLQQFLISQNKGPSAQALAAVGATAYFGDITRAALAEFQASVGISPALGNFGSITRAYVSTNY